MTENRDRPHHVRRELPALDTFTVPPRFAGATFGSYQPDARFPSQAAAVERLQEAVRALNGSNGQRSVLGRLRRSASEPDWQALYLDGRFGVGKTHLLAAAFHAAAVSKAYLSFQELTYATGMFGMPRALDLFAQARIVCLDEFELDDPGNTMLATSFVRGVIERGSRLIVTSNTLPGELGRGRFSAEEFGREIGSLAEAFDTVRIDGEDYRRRRFDAADALPRILPSEAVRDMATDLHWDVLLRTLIELPPLHYTNFVDSFETMAIDGIEPIPQQDAALRFVHFIDKLYDRATPLVVSIDCGLHGIFPPSYGYGGFERKFLRCQSRLHEMLAQPLTHARGEDDDPFNGVEEDSDAHCP
ncbi:MAG TPA: cell division protein ZapE [Thermomicrobiales bacterium]|nr:cell division protein ZapE [Thermomicrobiales bacterium]